MEVIVYSGNKILIQDISSLLTKMDRQLDLPVREASTEELAKIHKAVVNTINSRVDKSTGKVED